MLLKETLKEMNRLKSNCSVNSSIYALLKGHRLLLLIRNGHVAIAPNPCTKQHRNNTETSHANMRYANSLTPSPTVANHSCLRRIEVLVDVIPICRVLPLYRPFLSHKNVVESHTRIHTPNKLNVPPRFLGGYLPMLANHQCIS